MGRETPEITTPTTVRNRSILHTILLHRSCGVSQAARNSSRPCFAGCYRDGKLRAFIPCIRVRRLRCGRALTIRLRESAAIHQMWWETGNSRADAARPLRFDSGSIPLRSSRTPIGTFGTLGLGVLRNPGYLELGLGRIAGIRAWREQEIAVARLVLQRSQSCESERSEWNVHVGGIWPDHETSDPRVVELSLRFAF